MPQREPLSPPLLLSAATLAALPAAWLALAADALITGTAGAIAGFEWSGLTLAHSLALHAVQDTAGDHAPVAWAVALLAGPLATVVLAFAAYAVAETLGASAWLRVLVLEAMAFAALRVPALLLAAAIPPYHGNVGELYARLGDPQTGRWAVALLGLLALAGAALFLGRAGAVTGGRWMRVDGRVFRRRLVRTLVGYPVIIAMAAWCVAEPWAGPGWMVAWLALTFGAVSALAS